MTMCYSSITFIELLTDNLTLTVVPLLPVYIDLDNPLFSIVIFL